MGLWLLVNCMVWSYKVAATLHAHCYGEPGVNLPIRYFFGQLQEGGVNRSESIGPLRLVVRGEDDGCRHTSTVIDRGDGTFIGRVRVLGSCRQLPIAVVSSADQERPLCTLIMRNADGQPLLQEECVCERRPAAADWLELASCAAEPQLQHDLRLFDGVAFEDVLREAVHRFGQQRHARSHSICHYAIRDSKIYRKCYGEYVGFADFADSVLLSVARKMRLPDCQFIMNLGDYPLSYPKDREFTLPIVSWCGSTETADIVVPTYARTNTLLRGELYMPLHDPYSREPTPWAAKKDVAFFRGRDSNKLRLSLARLSDAKPNLLDAGIHRYFFFDKSKNPPARDAVRQSHFFKHRYIISVDGTVAAYRLPYLLAGDSVVLKSDSPHYEHFYSRLEPYVHYVPFNDENAEQVLNWVRKQDHNETISRMKQFFIDHLQPRNLFCYFAAFFEAYSKKIVSGDISIVGMDEISQDGLTNCNCGNGKNVDEL